MPPRRRQPRMTAAQAGDVAPRRSERLRLLREAATQSAAMALRPSANMTPTNLPIARASRAINGPRGRPRFRHRQGNDRNLLLQAAREAAEATPATPATPAARQRGFLVTLRNVLSTGMRSFSGGLEENPTTSAIRTSTPLPPPRGELPTEANRHHVLGRLNRELQDFMKEPPEGCQVEVVNDNLFNWRARVPGPLGTPYEGGEFHLDLHFAHNYPFTPPKVYFLTKIYHCNIAASGYICVDILNREWSPALTVAKVLLSITSLMADPNPDDPLDSNIARVYKFQRRQHDRTARGWTAQFAKPGQGPPEPEHSD